MADLKFLFIRNDDVFLLDRLFLEFFEFMYEQKIPVVYGVIPALLQKDVVVFLKKAKKKNPKLLDIVQHGFAHRNYAPQGEDKYEFGEARSYQQQYRDISEGMKIMRRCFGDQLTAGFIPPYHSDDENTIKAIEALKVPLYSARLKVPRRNKKFIDLPAQVWANKTDAKDLPLPLDFHKLSIDLATVLASGPITGLVFRHHRLVHPKDKQVLKALMKLVLQQRKEGKIRTVLFSELLNTSGEENDQ